MGSEMCIRDSPLTAIVVQLCPFPFHRLCEWYVVGTVYLFCVGGTHDKKVCVKRCECLIKAPVINSDAVCVCEPLG